MRTKLFMLCLLITVWLGLMGFPGDLLQISFLAIAPLIIFLFSIKLDLIPQKIYLNWKTILYLGWLVKEIYKSSYNVAKIILRKNMRLDSVFEWIEVKKLGSSSKVAYANSITLTPGTVTLDDRNGLLLIHALEQSSIDDLQKGEMRERVRKAFEK